jgi:hypothetical protein
MSQVSLSQEDADVKAAQLALQHARAAAESGTWEKQTEPLLVDLSPDSDDSASSESAYDETRSDPKDTILVSFSSEEEGEGEQEKQEPRRKRRKADKAPGESGKERWEAERLRELESAGAGSASVSAGATLNPAEEERRARRGPRRIPRERDSSLPLSWAERLYAEHTEAVTLERALKESARESGDSSGPPLSKLADNNDKLDRAIKTEDFGFGKTKNKTFGDQPAVPPPTTGFAPRDAGAKRSRVDHGMLGGEDGKKEEEEDNAPLLGGAGRSGGLLDEEEDGVCSCAIV